MMKELFTLMFLVAAATIAAGQTPPATAAAARTPPSTAAAAHTPPATAAADQILPAAAPAATEEARRTATERRMLDVDGQPRSYEIFVPAGLGEEVPLLIVLHGRGGTGAGTAALTGFNEFARSEGAIVAYPDGLEGQWNYLAGLGGNEGVDDVKFLESLVGEIARLHSVDPERFYAAGFSNGGFMVQRLACEAGSPFTAFATVAAAGFGGLPESCREPAPLSLMLVHGTSDALVPWEGQTAVIGGRELLLSASLPQTFAFWADRAGCGGRSEREDVPLPGPAPERIVVLRVTDCPENRLVALYALVGGGHEWPRLYPPTGAESNGAEFDATAEIWKFLGISGRSNR